jgi:hypothetical protein
VIKELAKGIAMRLVIRAGVAVLGVAMMLTWWTLTGKKADTTSRVTDQMPTRILSGGGQKLVIDVDTTGRGELAFDADLPGKPGERGESRTYLEKFDAGHHTWVIELAPRTEGALELDAINPQVGTRLGWSITVDGKKLADESQALSEPLKPGEAFFLRAYLNQGEDGGQSQTSGSHD